MPERPSMVRTKNQESTLSILMIPEVPHLKSHVPAPTPISQIGGEAHGTNGAIQYFVDMVNSLADTNAKIIRLVTMSNDQQHNK